MLKWHTLFFFKIEATIQYFNIKNISYRWFVQSLQLDKVNFSYFMRDALKLQIGFEFCQYFLCIFWGLIFFLLFPDNTEYYFAWFGILKQPSIIGIKSGQSLLYFLCVSYSDLLIFSLKIQFLCSWITYNE